MSRLDRACSEGFLATCFVVILCACGPARNPPVGTSGSALLELPQPNSEGLDEPVRLRLQRQHEAYESWRRSNPGASAQEQAQALREVGSLYLVYGFDLEAAAALGRAADIGRAFQDRYLEGVAWQRADRLDRAAGSFDAALELSPDDLPALLRRGRVAWESGDPTAAAGFFERALGLEASQPAALYGLALTRQSAPEEAVPLLRQVLELDPEAAAAHQALGLALRDLGELEEARQHLIRGGERRPNHPDPLFDRLGSLLADAAIHIAQGQAAAQAGELQKAASHFARATQLEPDSAKAHHNLGATLGQLGRHREAFAALRQACLLAPDDPGPRFDLATSLAYLGQLDESSRLFTEVLALSPGDREARRRRARVWAAQGRLTEATTELETLLKDDAADGASRLILEQLRSAGSASR